MDWTKVQAVVIRFFWATVFPGIGMAIDWALVSGNLNNVGVKDPIIIAVISGVLYAAKKALFPNTKF